MALTNREVLKRIAALLFALAELADRASLAPPPVRALVLVALRPAEVVAQALVIGMARDLGIPMPPQAEPDGDEVDDPTHLAFRLRILALVLAYLSARCFTGNGSGCIAVTIEASQKRGQLAGCRGKSTPTPDTS